MLVMQSGSAVPVVSYGYTALVLEYNIAGLTIQSSIFFVADNFFWVM